MGWGEVMGELEEKVERTLKGEYSPPDGVPFFYLPYPPEQEREALREFRLLAERLERRGLRVAILSISQLLCEFLAERLGCPEGEVVECLTREEREQDRKVFGERISRVLEREFARMVAGRIREAMPGKGVCILVRTGALYPFRDILPLASSLVNEVDCVLVIAHPGRRVGEFLDRTSGGVEPFFRGEEIRWR